MIMEAFSLVFDPMCILMIFIGVIIGIVFGSIPGLSATMAIVLFLPMSFGMEPMNGIALLIGLYMGGISGGLISAILLKIPGTPSSIATIFDGGPMADKGQAGPALGVGILFSFLGGMLSIFALMFLSPYLAAVTLKFTPVEYFSIAIFALTIIASLSGNSLLNGLLAGLFGIALGLVGLAPIDAYTRLTFGQYQLLSGFDVVVLLIGLFAVSDVIMSGYGRKGLSAKMEKKPFVLKGYGITLKEFKGQIGNLIRSSLIGISIGILPGIGGSTAGILAYNTQKNLSKEPEKFGTGIKDGVVASETANNAVIGGSMIPLLTMGIPGNTVTAILLGGLIVHGISPGPLIFDKSGQYVYGIFIALIIANIFMLIFERAGLRVFAKLLDMPKHILLPIVIVCCVVGAYSTNVRVFDIWCVLAFGLVGVMFRKFNIPFPPLIIGFLLGTMAEENLRRALQASDGSIGVFFTSPTSLFFLVIALLSVLFTLKNHYKTFKKSH